MEAISRPLSEPLGHYRFHIGSNPPLEVSRPYYAIRSQYLPMRKDWFLQVLVMILGEMVWINADKARIFPMRSHS